MNFLLLLWGVYVGLGAAIGAWYVIDDHPLFPDEHLAIEIVQGVIIAYVWGPLLLGIWIKEDLLP